MKTKRIAIVLAIVGAALALTACGPSEHVEGIVTAKIRPSGSEASCNFDYCDTQGNYFRIVVEPVPGRKVLSDADGMTYAYVCTSPSYWYKTKIGDRYVGGTPGTDLNCDG